MPSPLTKDLFHLYGQYSGILAHREYIDQWPVLSQKADQNNLAAKDWEIIREMFQVVARDGSCNSAC